MAGETWSADASGDLQVHIDERGVASVVLNRPGQRNAMSMALIHALHNAATALRANRDVRAVVLTGAGDVFCSGGDLEWMRGILGQPDEEKADDAMALACMLDAFYRLDKPVIARVQGGAYGGGVGLMSVADIVIAAEDARFALAEVRLGVIPATIAPYVVARIGAAQGRSLMVTGRPVDAANAQRIGLVDIVCDAHSLDQALEREVANALATAPGSTGHIKRLLSAFSLQPQAHFKPCIDQLVEVWNTREAAEGIGAFLQKRKPAWARR
jgi:methylglutaconyl-CoA hydratase